eukprot:1160525-Pelagomonas_calceolata.AAC.7
MKGPARGMAACKRPVHPKEKRYLPAQGLASDMAALSKKRSLKGKQRLVLPKGLASGMAACRKG